MKPICAGWMMRCRNPAGCDHRYNTSSSEARECPKCGFPRQKCKVKAVDGYKYCKFHGGPNPRNNFYGTGKAIVTGKNSNFPLTRLAGKYAEMQTDGRLLSNRASLDMVRKRISDLAERIDMNQAPDRTKNLQKAWENYKKWKDTPDKFSFMQALDDEFEKAYHDYEAWRQMFEAVDLDRKLVESEVKIIKDIRAVLTAEDAYNLTAQLLGAIISTVNGMEDVSDLIKKKFMQRIQYEFTRIVGEKFSRGTRGGGEEDSDAESGDVD